MFAETSLNASALTGPLWGGFSGFSNTRGLGPLLGGGETSATPAIRSRPCGGVFAYLSNKTPASQTSNSPFSIPAAIIPLGLSRSFPLPHANELNLPRHTSATYQNGSSETRATDPYRKAAGQKLTWIQSLSWPRFSSLSQHRSRQRTHRPVQRLP